MITTLLFVANISLILSAERILGDLVLRNRHIHLQVIVVVVTVRPRHILQILNVTLRIVGSHVVGHEARLLHIRTEAPLAVELLTALSVDSDLPNLRLEALLSSILGVVSLGILDNSAVASEWDRILGAVLDKCATFTLVITILVNILSSSDILSGNLCTLYPASKAIVVRQILSSQSILIAILELTECTVTQGVNLIPSCL